MASHQTGLQDGAQRMDGWQDTFDLMIVVSGGLALLAFVASLVATLINEAWRLWPLPPSHSLASGCVWMAFRIANVAVLLLAISSVGAQVQSSSIDPWQAVALAAAAVLFAAYLYALWALGKAATYGSVSGLTTRGVYRLTRNPQYTTAIFAYSALAAGTATPLASGLALALAGSYALMAIVEEPWLAARYGDAYRDYCRRVPRFVGLRHLITHVADAP